MLLFATREKKRWASVGSSVHFTEQTAFCVCVDAVPRKLVTVLRVLNRRSMVGVCLRWSVDRRLECPSGSGRREVESTS